MLETPVGGEGLSVRSGLYEHCGASGEWCVAVVGEKAEFVLSRCLGHGERQLRRCQRRAASGSFMEATSANPARPQKSCSGNTSVSS